MRTAHPRTDDGPSRWWVPVTGLDPERVKLEHLHAAVSHWFDGDAGVVDHKAQLKPYALSPIAQEPTGEVGFEIGILSAEARHALQSATDGDSVLRLGAMYGTVQRPRLLYQEPWKSMNTPSGASSWELLLETPTTFRQGNRSTPLPTPPAILRGLGQHWEAFSGLESQPLVREEVENVWISRLQGETRTFALSYSRARRGVVVAGFLGTIGVRCDPGPVAAKVDRLLRLAPYCGVGSMREKGLGVARLVALRPTRLSHP